MFRKSGCNKSLVLCSTKKNRTVLENWTKIFDEIAEQIELTTSDEVKYYRDILNIKFKTNDDLPFNEKETFLCV